MVGLMSYFLLLFDFTPIKFSIFKKKKIGKYNLVGSKNRKI